MRGGVRGESGLFVEPYPIKRHNAIRVGLSHIKGLSGAAIGSIIENRRYASVDDFLDRTLLDIAEAEALVNSGALDRFGHNRPALMWKARLWRAGRATGVIREGRGGLFPAERAASNAVGLAIPRLADYTEIEKMRLERETLGFTTSAHPLRMFSVATRRRLTRAADLPRRAGETVTLVGWLVTAKRTRTVNGRFMKFLTLEDETDIFEATLFPAVYARFGRLITGRGPYIVTGKVDGREGDVSIVVVRVEPAWIVSPAIPSFCR